MQIRDLICMDPITRHEKFLIETINSTFGNFWTGQGISICEKCWDFVSWRVSAVFLFWRGGKRWVDEEGRASRKQIANIAGARAIHAHLMQLLRSQATKIIMKWLIKTIELKIVPVSTVQASGASTRGKSPALSVRAVVVRCRRGGERNMLGKE